MGTTRCVLALMVLFHFAESNDYGSFSESRVIREVGAPSPIDCEMSPWGEWSECNPCTELKYRSRSINKFGQYGGRRCLDSLGEDKFCRPAKPCEKEPIECGNDFECDSGRCIKKRLVCNVDNDCGDFSDEECGESDPKSPCRGNEGIDVSELGRTAGNGVHILGMDTRSNPFNNEFYNGLCDRVRDGNTRTYYRKPWNVASLAYETRAEKKVTSEVYKSSMDVVVEIIKEETQSFQFGISFKTVPTENSPNVNISGGIGINTSKNRSLQQMKEFSQDTNKEFLKVRGQVQVGTFQMRSRENMVTDTFLNDLTALPVTYEKGEYYGFLENYGTHYSVSGSVGGQYELIYVLDSNELKSKEITAEEVSECLGYNVKVNVGGEGISGGAHIDGNKCSKSGAKGSITPGSSGIIKQIIPFVKGGTVEFVTKLNEKLARDHSVLDYDDYVGWASSLVDGPVVIKQKPAPIYNLVPPKMKNAFEKKENLERSINDYLEEHSECRCQPCQNGGTVLLLDGECLCQCSIHFRGIACQTHKSELLGKIPPIDGKWGCWTAWSDCVRNTRRRTRLCNKPSPGPEGQQCQGLNEETETC